MRRVSAFHISHDAGEFVGRVDHDAGTDGLVHAKRAWGLLALYREIDTCPDSHDLKIVDIRINQFGGIE